MKRFKVLGWLLLANLFAMISVHAYSPSYLANTPLNYFTKKDWNFSENASYEALEHGKDGKKVIWQNPQSGASGYSLPSQSRGNCKQLRIFSQARGLTSETEYRFCKVKGEWKIVE